MFTEPLADIDFYWLGYIRADGCLVSNIGNEYSPGKYRSKGGYLQFAQKNIEAVSALHKYVNGSGAVKFRSRMSNFGFNELHHFSSSKPYYSLLKLGAKGDIDERVYTSKHFWRGLLDGDGSIGFVKNRGIEYPVIAWSGSKIDMEYCSKYIYNLGLKPPKVGSARSIFRVALNGAAASYLAKHLYEHEYCANKEKEERSALVIAWKGKKQHLSKFSLTTTS